MVLNKIHKIHTEKGDSYKPSSIVHKTFDINGTYDFHSLSFEKYGWSTFHPSVKPKSAPERIEFEETLVYSGPQGIAVMNIDYDTGHHKVEIILKENSENNYETIEKLKLMFEKELGEKLKESGESNLENKLK